MKELYETAVEVAHAGGKKSLHYFGSEAIRRGVEYKADASPVTEADRTCELLIRDLIEKKYPGHGIIGEEFSAVASKEGAPTWIIDPIDGTKAFVAGVPLYTVLVAVVMDKTPVVGVIYNPVTDETVSALSGGGCFYNGEGISLDQPSAETDHGGPKGSADSSSTVVCCSDYADLYRRRPNLLSTIANEGYSGRTWADAYGYLLLVTRRVAAVIDPIMSSWDIAPLYPIIEEAGGTITSLEGKREPLGTSAVAASRALHTTLLRAAQS